MGNGATELIHSLIRELHPRRTHLVVPTFSEYRRALRDCDVSTTRWEQSEGDETNLERIVMDVLGRDADLLILTNPNNPTGHMIPSGALVAKLIDRLPVAVRVLVDESFIDFAPEPSAAALHGRRGLFILRSLTKFYAMPGLRIGCLIGGVADIVDLTTARAPWQTNILAEKAAEAALADVEFQKRSIAFIERERRWLTDKLAGLPGIEPLPSAANFILCRWKSRVDGLAEHLFQQRILIRDCTATEGVDGDAFRVAVRTRVENERLIACMEEFLD